MPRIGISCISHVQLPWGRLPGNGHVFPEILVFIYKSVVVKNSSTPKGKRPDLGNICLLHPSFIIRRYRWGSWAMNMPPFFLSTSGTLDCNNNPCASLLCTDAWNSCTSPGCSLCKLQLIFPFLDPQLFRHWTPHHRFWGLPYNSPRDRARLRAPSIAPHSWLPGRKSLPWGCCPGGSRWRCSCGWSLWTRCQRNPRRGQLGCFLDIIVLVFSKQNMFL